MTTDNIRDELAERAGWTPVSEDTDMELGRWLWQKTLRTGDVDKREDHPFPPTLDGANAAVPEGYRWNRRPNARGVPSWFGWHVHDDADVPLVEVPDHGRGHEMADLYALALKCRKAMENKT